VARLALPTKIVSGGQTGVDRGALDAAIASGVEHGGWCPRGRRAEDGRVPDRYRLRETASRDYAARTEQNVLDADGTLILCVGVPTEGTALTRRLAEQHGKPCRVVDLQRPDDPAEVRAWLAAHAIRVLNVAGPRESTHPGVHRSAADFIRRLLTETS
jgi:Circularly permutated YpsA SLOG family